MPFHVWPVYDQREIEAVTGVIESRNWWRYSHGESSGLNQTVAEARSHVGRFQMAFAEDHGCRYGIAAANGTDSLNLIMKALGIGPGDEVIVPPYSFIATATCVLEVNAIPVFVDIDPLTYNLDPNKIGEAITDRTRAVLPVHFAGRIADMTQLNAIGEGHSLTVVEDAAQAHGACLHGKMAGSLGLAGSFSFQASKNMTAGEGGIVTTNDYELAERVESLAWSGRAFGSGWYSFATLGWNARMTEMQGALLTVQLSRLAEQTRRRQANAAYLSPLLQDLPGINPPAIATDPASHAHHLYIMRYREQELETVPRDLFVGALQAEGIPVTTGYPFPLYKNAMFRNQDFWANGCPLACGHYPEQVSFAGYQEKCPAAEKACQEALWLPHQLLLGSERDMDDIAAACEKIVTNIASLLTAA